ncbi:MAG: isoaspartyl peptidase/L-asparaginase, partial [Pyrinomonadaceae bacterium]
KAAAGEKKVGQTGAPTAELPYNKFGTVGAVALDRNGNLAAGTSTGGMTNKKYGRVGDAPIIGAGTYANNETCAVSATGWGEYFIRLGVARDISALMEYRTMTVQSAADLVIKQKLQKLGGDGGVIAMDKFGNMAISFNSEGMYRAYIGSDGKPVVEIYKD